MSDHDQGGGARRGAVPQEAALAPGAQVAVPSGRLVRTARLAALPAALAGRKAVGFAQRLGGRSAEAVAEQVQQQTAEQLFRTLGELKGGAMKAGQALSAMQAVLPDQLAAPYRDALVRLQEAAPPMPAALVHRTLDASFPSGWRRLFASFEDQPVAAASIGQVHRAVLRDGTPVAVKVQYPGAGQALAADMRALEQLAPVLRAAAPGLDARSLFAELRARLAEEVDYVAEADAQTAFAHAYRGDPDLAVPGVLLVEDRVLVTRWLDGTPLSRVVSAGTAQDRDRCGLLLLRLLLSGPVRAGRLHGDPHPGNFRLLPDGRLGVLDFGSTEPLPHGWPRATGPLLAALRDEDAAALHALAVRTGLVRADRVDAAALLDLLGPYGAPLRTPTFCFERQWLQGQAWRTSDPRSAAARTQRYLSVPARHLLVQRVAAGLAGVLTLLRATVPVSTEVERWIPDAR